MRNANDAKDANPSSSQLVSLLLDLEILAVCQRSWVQSPFGRGMSRSPTCRLLVTPPTLTCLSCLPEDEEEVEEEDEEEEQEWGMEVRENGPSASLRPSSPL